MRTVNLKNTTPERLFRNKEAIKRLLKRKSYFFQDNSENSFNGILMLSETKGIKLRYANFTGDYPNAREVINIKYTKATKTFI